MIHSTPLPSSISLFSGRLKVSFSRRLARYHTSTELTVGKSECRGTMIPGRTPACREASTIKYRVRTYIKACNYRTRPPPILPSFNPSRWLVWPCTLYIGCLGYERSTESCTHYSSHRLYPVHPQQKSAALSQIWRISTPPTVSLRRAYLQVVQTRQRPRRPHRGVIRGG